MGKGIRERVYYFLLEREFKQYLERNLSTENYLIIKKFSWYHFGKMSSMFGLYEDCNITFAPAYNHPEAKKQLNNKQSEAFEEAFFVLKKAEPRLLELIRQFS